MTLLKKLIFMLSLGFISQACQTNLNLIKIRVYTPNPADTNQVYISGNIETLGMWQPNKIAMTFKRNHLWEKTFITKPGASVEYKFTLGSWQKEGLDKDGNTLSNFSINTATTRVKTDTIYQFGQALNKIVGQITGQVQYFKDQHADGLLDRDVIVWLPPDYDKDLTKKYAVLYMHDGQNLFDPKTSSFGTDWQVDESCDSLIKMGKIPPVIVVGINNTADRNLEYSPGSKGTAYMNFIIYQLKPMIDSTYRTLTDRKHTFVGGSSMGGLISMMLVWEHPKVFYGAICMSPAFQYQDFDYIPKITSDKTSKKNIKIYFDIGTVGLETQLQPGLDAMVKALNSKDYLKNKDYFYVKEENAKHTEADWARRLPKALIFLLN